MKTINFAAKNIDSPLTVDFTIDPNWEIVIDKTESRNNYNNNSLRNSSIPSIGHITEIEVLGLSYNEAFHCSITTAKGDTTYSGKLSPQHQYMHSVDQRVFFEVNMTDLTLIKPSFEMTDLEDDFVELCIPTKEIAPDDTKNLPEEQERNVSETNTPSLDKSIAIKVYKRCFEHLSIGVVEDECN